MNCTNARINLQQRGFTLLELVVAMSLFLVVLAIAGKSFDRIYSLSSRFTKNEETSIEGAIGLEVMRHDLEQMGFGLPWSFLNPALTYNESIDSVGSTLNDATSAIPRAFVGVDTSSGYFGNYIGIKGASVGTSKSSQRWSYIPFNNVSTATGKLSQPIAWPTNNLQTTDKVVVVRSNFNDPTDDHLLLDSGGVFSSPYSATFASAFLPTSDQQTHMIYGIDTVTPRMPFNRADYFITVPNSTTTGSLPQFCAPSTGVLYKGTVNHSDGSYSYTPLLNCVADMRVVLGWDTSDQGNANSVNAYSSVTGTTVTGASVGDITGYLSTAKGVREHLKMVKVYILAQEGKVDPHYTAPSTTINVCNDDEVSLANQYVLSAAQSHYRWRLYRIVARPKNLFSNQH